jgi:polygalacturonase
MTGDQGNPTSGFNVRAYGAAGDGQTLDTHALQAAIDACHQQGGGTVLVPAGQYLTGSLFMQSHITLHLAAGAVLLGSEDPADYPVWRGRWEGTEQETHAPLIAGRQLQNITLTGRGTIDGRGEIWWERHHTQTLAYPRPRLVSFADCTNVLIEGLTFTRSPSWTINPVRCENVTVQGVTILNPPDSPNTDGINPDSCAYVRIANCYVSAGDDCITLKAGTEAEAPDQQAPCCHITITNCTLARGHGGVVIGSEMSGDVRNVVISNCVFVGTDRGLRLKSRRGRGGVVEDVRVTNLVMQDVLCPFTMNLYYACGAWGDPVVSDRRPQPVAATTPQFRHIHLSHITARGAHSAAGFLYGLAEQPVEDITLSDISISMAPEAPPSYPEMADGLEQMQRAGLFICNARGLRLQNIEITGQLGPAVMLADSAEVEINATTTPTPAAAGPVILLHNVEQAFVHSCRAAAATPVFLRVEGVGSQGIMLHGNLLARAGQPLQVASEVPVGAVQADFDLSVPGTRAEEERR